MEKCDQSRQETVQAGIRTRKGTDRMSNGQSFKACLPPEIYAHYFRCKQREQEFNTLKNQYKLIENHEV